MGGQLQVARDASGSVFVGTDRYGDSCIAAAARQGASCGRCRGMVRGMWGLRKTRWTWCALPMSGDGVVGTGYRVASESTGAGMLLGAERCEQRGSFCMVGLDVVL